MVLHRGKKERERDGVTGEERRPVPVSLVYGIFFFILHSRAEVCHDDDDAETGRNVSELLWVGR